MDEQHWMTSHGCLAIVGCHISGEMRVGLLMGLLVLFGYVSSQ